MCVCGWGKSERGKGRRLKWDTGADSEKRKEPKASESVIFFFLDEEDEVNLEASREGFLLKEIEDVAQGGNGVRVNL